MSQAISRELAYQPSRQMTVGEASTVTAIIGTNAVPPPQSVTGVTGTTVVVRIKTSCDVEAQLIGGDFQIDPSEAQEKSFYGTSVVSWTWYVTPETAGRNLQLELVINSLFHLGNGITLASTARSALVKIRVDAASKSLLEQVDDVSDYPIFATVAGAAIVSASAIIFRRLRKIRRKSPAGAPATPPAATRAGHDEPPGEDKSPPP
jgi:hypothetical protein